MNFIAVFLASLVVWFGIFSMPATGGHSSVPKRHHVKRKPTKWQLRHRRRQRERLAVIRAAERLIGTRYVYGGTGRGGVDCSGLTRYAYAAVGKYLPHLAAAQERLGRYVSQRRLRPGDLLFYNDGGHVAMYVGDGQMIEASSYRGQVIRTELRGGWFVENYDQARRLIG